MYQKSSDLRKYLIISIYIDFLRFYFPFFCIHWLMGYNGIIGLIIRETELASDCVNTWMNLTEGKPNLCGKFIEKQAQMKKMNTSNNSYL